MKFTHKNDVVNKKLPPQLQTILAHIKAAGPEGITREVLCDQLAEGNKLNTRQPIERVVNFYITRMEELDAVTVLKPEKLAPIPAGKRTRGETVVLGPGDVGTVQAPPQPGRPGHGAKPVV